MPSDSFLSSSKKLPPEEDHCAHVDAKQTAFVKLCVDCKTTPAAEKYISKNKMLFDDVLELLQCFRVLTKLKSPWGGAELDHPVRHKCDCAHFYKYMNCKHSLREAILSGLRVPPKHAFGSFGPKAKRGRRCVPLPVSCSDSICLYIGKFLKKVVRMQIWQWPRQRCDSAALELDFSSNDEKLC